MHGQQVLLDQAVDEILIGSDPDCRMCLDLPGVSPMHARVWIDLEGASVHDTRSPAGVFVNDDRVVGQARLRNGDILWLGPPGAEGSVMIRCTLPTYGMEEPVAVPIETDELFVAEPEPTPAVPEFLVDPVVGEPEPVAHDDAGAIFEAAQFGLDDIAPEPPPAAQAGVGAEPQEPAAPAVDPFGMDLPEVLGLDESAPPPAAEPSGFTIDPALDVDPGAIPGFAVDSAPASQPQPGPIAPAPADLAAAPGDGSADPFFVDESPAPVAFDVPVGAPDFQLEAAHEAPPTVVTSPPPAAEPDPEIAVVPPAPPPGRAVVDAVRVSPAPDRSKPAPARPAVARPAASPAARPVAARPKAAGTSKLIPVIAGAALVLGVGAFFGWRALSAPQLSGATPGRVGVGQTLTLAGKNLGSLEQVNVLFGDKPGRVIEDSGVAIQVEVPELQTTVAKDTQVTIAVSVGGRKAGPILISVFRPPHIHGLSPNVGLPGEEMTIEGTGFAAGVKVMFGKTPTEVLAASATTLKLKVPELGAVGTQAPVSVSMGPDASNALPFVIGRLPLVLGVQPENAQPGDVVTVTGRGFLVKPSANTVQIAGRRALVVSATDVEMKLVVPWTGAFGETPFEVRVQGIDNVGQGTVSLAPLPDPLGFRFAAEPFEDTAGHDHAAVASAFGPAFVLSAAGGRSAPERAIELATRLNAAASQIKSQDLEVRGLDSKPAIGFAGRPEALWEVAPEDAAGYEEDWTQLRGRGGPVTPARLALWWAAVARDLGLLLVRAEKPGQAVALAPEGRAFVDLWQAAQKAGRPGVPAAMLAELKPPQRAAFELIGKRVPPTVTGPVSASAVPAIPPLQLEGSWQGSQTITAEGKKYVTVNFTRNGGSLTLEAAISLTVQVSGLEQTRQGQVRFRLQTGTVTRFYQGSWDGEKIAGSITADPAGKTVVGSFELTRNR